jgi:hypothetical protein
VRTTKSRALLVAALATLGVAAAAGPAGAATLTVKNANDGGAGSLRNAINQANVAANRDDIVFDIPAVASHVITPVAALPAITAPVTIDGYTQPGAAPATPAAPAQLVVVIDAVNVVNGLTLATNASLIRGLAIQDSAGGAVADGIEVVGANNRIEGNYVGTDENGESLGMWNLADGVSVAGNGNRIGGTTTEARNVIAEASDDGVTIVGNGNVVEGNNVGLPLSAAALGNFGDGVSILGNNNVVGGTGKGARNVISENNDDGVRISGQGNRIEGNYIGTDESGEAGVGNIGNGVAIGGNGNVVGGTTPEARNVIAANNAAGVWLNGDANVVEGNALGIDVWETVGIGNGDGVRITGDGNRVGGPAEGAENVISDNGDGVLVESGTANVVQGNLVGTDGTGAVALGNQDRGIHVTSDSNTIGGAAPGEGNVVSGHWDAGVKLAGDATHNVVAGNLIGTDGNGTAPLPNGYGVLIEGSSRNTIGGREDGTGNVISGNDDDGVLIRADGDVAADDNTVIANAIGTDADLALDLGNGVSGVRIENGDGNSIGSVTTSVPMNTIAHNDVDAVTVESGVQNPILRNSMFDNGELGIDLDGDGVTGNDGQPDADSGANDLQNFPTLDNVFTTAQFNHETLSFEFHTFVDWTLNSVPDTEYRLEFYGSDRCNRQGERLVGSLTVTTDANGHAEGSASISNLEAGEVVVATATLFVPFVGLPAAPDLTPILVRSYRSTSEFSPCEAL